MKRQRAAEKEGETSKRQHQEEDVRRPYQGVLNIRPRQVGAVYVNGDFQISSVGDQRDDCGYQGDAQRCERPRKVLELGDGRGSLSRRHCKNL